MVSYRTSVPVATAAYASLIEGANSALSRVILFMSALNLGSVECGNPAPSGWGIARSVAF